MQKTIIEYYDLAITSASKLKVAKEKENKLKEEITTLRKSCDARLVEKEKMLSQEHDWAVDASSKLG